MTKYTSNKFSDRERSILFLSFLIVLVTPFASDSYTPSLPAMTKVFNTVSDYMQLTMTSYLIGVAVSQLIYGPISDRYGRRPIILIGLFITVIGSLLCAFATTLSFIIFARLVQGAGAGVCNALYRALMRDQFTGHKMSQVGSYSGMFYTLAFATAPILGGYIQVLFGWQANFIFVALIVLIIFLILLPYLPETHHARDASATKLKNVFRNYFRLITSLEFVGFTLISSFAYSGFVAYYTAAPFIMENRIGLTAAEFGELSLGIAVGLFAGMFLNVNLVAKKGVKFMLLSGLVIMSLSSIAMLVGGIFEILNTTVVIIPVIFFALASSFVFANAMTLAFQNVGHIAGAAGGMYGFIQVFVASFASMLMASLHEATQMPLALVLTGLSLASLILYFLLIKYKIDQF